MLSGDGMIFFVDYGDVYLCCPKVEVAAKFNLSSHEIACACCKHAEISGLNDSCITQQANIMLPQLLDQVRNVRNKLIGTLLIYMLGKNIFH